MRRVAAAVVAGLAIAVSGTATASRAPTSAERTTLTREATAYIDQAKDHCCVHGLRATVVSIRISTVDAQWATVAVHSKNSAGVAQEPAVLVLHRVKGKWDVKIIGEADLGCGVPKTVRKDLGLSCN